MAAVDKQSRRNFTCSGVSGMQAGVEGWLAAPMFVSPHFHCQEPPSPPPAAMPDVPEEAKLCMSAAFEVFGLWCTFESSLFAQWQVLAIRNWKLRITDCTCDISFPVYSQVIEGHAPTVKRP